MNYSGDGYRVFNFKSVELVRLGVGPARITRVTAQKIEYTNESGRELFVDLEECARIGGCLETAGLFPPSSDMDWTSVADAICGPGSETTRGCVGLRGAMDDPPWFQFLNRRRTQFEFKDYDAIYAELLTPMGRMTFDAS